MHFGTPQTDKSNINLKENLLMLKKQTLMPCPGLSYLLSENKCIASLVNRNRDEFMILARYMLYSKTHSTLINKALQSHHNEVECERKMLDIRCRKNQFGKCKIFVCTLSRLTACYNCVKRTIWECQAYRKEFAKVFTKKTFQTIE